MNDKKKIRANFRDVVFKRDNYKCKKCGFISSKEKCELELDAHHLINRNEFKNGGYFKENGITLCKNCHFSAEKSEEGFEQDVLFRLIGSSKEIAKKLDK